MADTLVPPVGSVPLTAAATFDNTSMWHNFTAWTAQHLAFLNVTRLAPSLDDLVWAGPRMVMKLGKLGSFISFPEAIDGFGQRVIPDATESGILFHAATTTPPAGIVAGVAGAGGQTLAAADQELAGTTSRFSLESARGLGSVFSYATSKWALCCIAMAIILNRTHIFAATRRPLRLRWPVRLALRILPIVLFLMQARWLLQSIQCQTSPNFAEMRWGNASKSSDVMFAQPSAFLHGLSSTLLLGPTDEESCRAIHMIPSDRLDLASELRGSLSLLWPLFGTFCLSQFIETLSCAVQGRPVAAETGMTVFEHSLAFAEADAAISNQLGFGTFSSSAATNATFTNGMGATIAISRSMIMRRVNTPPEVLLLAFLSAMSHVSSHVLGVLNLQSRLRLLNTGFWAMCFMGSIIWSAATFSLDDPARQSLLRFPTVSIIGFIPHVLVLGGIITCCSIYGLALLLSTLAQPEGENLSFRQRLARAHANMQANVSMGDIRISMEMDFYTALLRVGFDTITLASEAVYLNEDRRVNLKRQTWLEDERYKEIEELRMQWMGSGIPGSRYDSIGTIGLVPVKDGRLSSTSGYSRERAAQKVNKNKAGERLRPIRDGVGAAERSGRWLMAVEYLMHVNRLITTALAIYLCRVLAWMGLQNPPRWLAWLARRPKPGRPEDQAGANRGGRGDANEQGMIWLTSGGTTGSVRIPHNEQVDVEYELRQRLTSRPAAAQSEQLRQHSPRAEEREIDNSLYNWWLGGGWWGNTDTSGDYRPSVADDEDLTSVISASDAASIVSGFDDGWESEPGEDQGAYYYEDEGQRTPTQRSPFASREATPLADMPLATADLARLLSQRTPEDREEARALAAHLASDGILTRSAYKRFQQRQRAQVLLTPGGLGLGGLGGLGMGIGMDIGRGGTSGSGGSGGGGGGAKLTPDEEAQLLEQILLSRRAAAFSSGLSSMSQQHQQGGEASSWATGAAGLGPDGPQCVVCQSAPRTIIVWPCRCLSLCDDCRVSLAMNNFDKCVCCRREVISFSRIYVP